MVQVAAISVATEPVSRIRSANLRDSTSSWQRSSERGASASPAAFEDPAAVVHIGAQARALARRDSSSERSSQRPSRAPGGVNSDGPLAAAARTAAQARASATVERDEGEDESPGSSENPLAEAASSAAEALWGGEEEREGSRAADEAEGSSPGGVNRARNGVGEVELSAAERRKLEEMQQRDREVRQQEQSQATSAQFNGPVRYEYRMGPDGKLYAVEGSAPIDVRPVEGDPEATLRKAQAAERAARSSTEPSISDQQVAAEAARVAQRARAELAAARYNENRDVGGVRRAETTLDAGQARALQGGDGSAPTGEAPRDREPRGAALPGAQSEQSASGTPSSAALDLASLSQGTPPALRRYEEQQQPTPDVGAGFQLVA